MAAAAREFGVSASSIRAWMSEAGGPEEQKARALAEFRPYRHRARTSRALKELISLRSGIDALERQLERKQARFEKLKKLV